MTSSLVIPSSRAISSSRAFTVFEISEVSKLGTFLDFFGMTTSLRVMPVKDCLENDSLNLKKTARA